MKTEREAGGAGQVSSRFDRRLAYPGAGAILRDAEFAHLIHSGFLPNLVSDLLAVFGDHLDLLSQCRIDAVRGRA